MTASLNENLIEKLLDGAITQLAENSPIVRLGEFHYVKYDAIKIGNRKIRFFYHGDEMACMVSEAAQIGPTGYDELTISDLQGRLKTGIR